MNYVLMLTIQRMHEFTDAKFFILKIITARYCGIEDLYLSYEYVNLTTRSLTAIGQKSH